MKKISFVLFVLCISFIESKELSPILEHNEVKLMVFQQKIDIGFDDDPMFLCRIYDSMPKNIKEMEEYLKKHIVIDDIYIKVDDICCWGDNILHYEFGACPYYGKVKFNGRIWYFHSIAGLTELVRPANNEPVDKNDKWQGKYLDSDRGLGFASILLYQYEELQDIPKYRLFLICPYESCHPRARLVDLS